MSSNTLIFDEFSEVDDEVLAELDISTPPAAPYWYSSAVEDDDLPAKIILAIIMIPPGIVLGLVGAYWLIDRIWLR